VKLKKSGIDGQEGSLIVEGGEGGLRGEDNAALAKIGSKEI